MLVATGRAPLVEGIGLEEIGVAVRQRRRGSRPTSIGARRFRTSTRSATAPATGSSRTPRSARARSRPRTPSGTTRVVDNRGVPRPIYTDPEIAGVGLTEAEAREQYGDDVAVGEFPWVANARAVMQNATVGWVKSIHETRYGELLGLVMVGPHVTDLIEAGVVALDAESTVETVADGMAPHPTLSEAIKEAGLVALGRAIHLPPKRKAAAKAWEEGSTTMSIVNRRNVVLGWATWTGRQAGSLASKAKLGGAGVSRTSARTSRPRSPRARLQRRQRRPPSAQAAAPWQLRRRPGRVTNPDLYAPRKSFVPFAV